MMNVVDGVDRGPRLPEIPFDIRDAMQLFMAWLCARFVESNVRTSCEMCREEELVGPAHASKQARQFRCGR